MEEQNTIQTNTIPLKIETISSNIESEDKSELQESQILDASNLILPSRQEELQARRAEALELSQNQQTQTSLSTSQQWALSKENLAEKQLGTIIAALEKAGLDDDYIMWVIKEGIENAVFQGPKGAILRDRPSIIKLVDKYLKLKKYYKSDTVINVLNAFANPSQLY